jgi:hypothetical protein
VPDAAGEVGESLDFGLIDVASSGLVPHIWNQFGSMISGGGSGCLIGTTRGTTHRP